MPTYEYECTSCGHRFDVVQKFSDAALTTCDQCQGALRKLISAPGIVFKGGGFYMTDSRGTSSSSDSSGASSTSSDA